MLVIQVIPVARGGGGRVVTISVAAGVIVIGAMHCKNESVYCTLNCPNTHTKNKTVCVLGQNGVQ